MGATDTTATVDAGVDPALVETIQNIEDGDVLVVNGDSRTWDVTDVVDRPIEDPNDARESKRVCRLSCGGSVFGLELVTYPDRHTASLHVLATEDWTEDVRVFEVHDVAKSAIAKAQQLEADSDHQEDAEQLPEGIEPSSSPLDFFANCRQSKVKTMFVERSNRQNTYRAITVAKRWPEFATTRTDGSGVFMTKADLQTALTAELGKEPHRQTVKRVWEKLVEIGGGDIVEKTRQVGRDQTQTEILAMDMDTAEGLLEKRYVGLDLLENSDHKAATGGVTPVVVESSP
jgi:hypothetical protein